MKNKKNILFVISSLKYGGGAEKVCSTIGTKLNQLGYNVHFLTFYHYDKLYPFEGKYKTLNEKLGGNVLTNFKKLFMRAKAIANYCKKNNIDTVIGFMEEANFSVILSKYFGNKAKLNVSVRNNLNKKIMLYKILVKLLYPKADNIIVISNEEKDNLIRNYRFKNVKIIYNPVGIDKIAQLSKEELGEYKDLFNNGKFIFINIGRLTKQKNQKQLIKVFKQFNDKYIQTQLMIIGKGELRKELEEEIGDNKNIYLLGLQKNPYKFLANSDVFVFPSLWEGFPNALVEALACGLPVISSDCSTGPCEILRKKGDYKKIDTLEIADYGILIPTGDEEELYKAMEKLYLDKKLIENLRKNSVKRAKHFDIDQILKKWIEIL